MTNEEKKEKLLDRIGTTNALIVIGAPVWVYLTLFLIQSFIRKDDGGAMEVPVAMFSAVVFGFVLMAVCSRITLGFELALLKNKD